MCEITISMMTFRNSFDILNNFYEAKVVGDGICYQSDEVAFQAQKCVDVEDKAAEQQRVFFKH